MASIGSLTSAYSAVYNPYQGQKVSSVAKTEPTAPPAKAASGNREQDLTQTLDTHLTEKLSRIRQQIGSAGNSTSGENGIRRSLDIRA